MVVRRGTTPKPMHHNAGYNGGGRVRRPNCTWRRGWAATLLLAVPALMSACTLSNPFASASPSPAPTSTASDSASPVSNQGATSAVSRLPVDQDLAFDGAISGHLDKAVTSCGGSNGQWNAALTADIGGTRLTIYLTLTLDKGPGNYPAKNGDGTINVAVHTAAVDYLGDTGGFTIATDHRSGTIDTRFSGNLRVSGKYACAST
jgi:hypothetical protein